MVAPRNAGAYQRERRRTLLQRRADLLSLIGEERTLPAELQARHIRRPDLRPAQPCVQGVWALTYPLALHPTVEDVHEVGRGQLFIGPHKSRMDRPL
jgi:hypothetical protein